MSRIPKYALVIVLIASAFIGGMHVGALRHTDAYTIKGFVGAPSTPPEGVDFSPLWKVWHVLNQKFVPFSASSTASISGDEMVWGAAQGLAQSLGDPYTVFLPPKENERFEEEISGEFGGVGMEIEKRDAFLIVVAPLRGSPAEAAGILAGDYVIEIDGTPTDSLSINESVRLIRGVPGTTVKFKIGREGLRELKDVVVTRDVIKIPTIETSTNGDVFIIELFNFGASSPSEFRRAMREFVLSGKTKLLIDLRSNPGGYLEASVDVASWFLPIGKPIVREHFGEGKNEIVHRSKGYDIYKPHWRVAVLIDRGSASASEIVAGALAEHGIATLIGEQTFGKGSVQELVPITKNTALKVTIARWLTPMGVSISENGLTPTIKVSISQEDRKAKRDPQLDRALEFLRTGK